MTEQGATVDVVMTEAATHFITPVTMQALSGRPVFVDAWDARVPNNMAHIDLTRGADAVLIAPASADFMACWRTAWPTTCCPRCAWRAPVRCWSRPP